MCMNIIGNRVNQIQKRIIIEYDNNIVFIGSGRSRWRNDKYAFYDGGFVCHHVVLHD